MIQFEGGLIAGLDLTNPTNPANYVDRYGGALRGTPLNWQDDVSGQMQEIVMSYLEQRATPEQLHRLIAYLQYHIHAPCWLESNPFGEVGEEMATEIRALRRRSLTLKTMADVNAYIHAALEIAIDPL